MAAGADPSVLTQAAAFLSWNGTLLALFGGQLAAVGLAYYNKYVAAGLALYAARAAVLRAASGPHSKFYHFSKYWPVLIAMRAHLQLSFAPLPKVLVQAEAKKGAQFIFALSPHGADNAFRILMDGMLDELFPNIHMRIFTLAASVLFCIPFVREMAIWTGCVDASRPVAEKVLSKGNSLIILPGGEAEQIMTQRGVEAVYLKDRKGFIRLAMRKNVPVVPGYVFGSNDTFHMSRLFYKVRYTIMKKFGICIPLSAGLLGTFCPLPEKNTICFGEPMSWKPAKAGEPTKEEIDKAHVEYVDALQKLFDKHKASVGKGDRTLKIV
mmetsp:Transcript_32388/g.79528  ORF Transcript_32388/g.79528 Transcript_32388/m.79528 type:complete len:324 (+) Transcript_32388:54-1025(+)